MEQNYILVEATKAGGIGDKIAGMGTYFNDTMGRRIAEMRKQKGIKSRDLASAIGVHYVYVSQIENDAQRPSLDVLLKIADVLGVSLDFLTMRSPTPAMAGDEQAPVYFAPEADAVAQLIDAAPPEERARIYAVVRALVDPVSQAAQETENDGVISLPYDPDQTNPVQQRLIFGKHRREQEQGARA